MSEEKFPSGKCEDCGKIFPRPNKFKTESEAYHIYGCRLDGIKRAIDNKEELGHITELIDEVKRISKVSSFGAKKGNRYFIRMDKCREIVEELKSLESTALIGKSKGCGRTIKRICNGGENVPYLCGGDKLCPKCSPLTGLSSEEKKQ